MKWSWKIGKIAGIDLYVHAAFLLLLGFVALSHLTLGNSAAQALQGVFFTVTLFSIVVLHELGHALTARRFGIRTRDITLLSIGGVARLERLPEDPRQELLVALGGPAVNVVLAAALFLLFRPAARLEELAQMPLGGVEFLKELMWINVVLAAFNMLPAFPMDGGRVLRALLAMRMNYVKATELAASIGQAMALLFGTIGLFINHPFLVLIAVFVWTGAGQEAAATRVKSVLGGIPIRQAMVTDFQTLAPTDTLARAVQHILAGFQQDFPVIDQGRLVGVLTRGDLMAELARSGHHASVSQAMQRDFQIAHPLDLLEQALMRLQDCQCKSLPVLINGELVGILTLDNVGEFLMVQSAMREGQA